MIFLLVALGAAVIYLVRRIRQVEKYVEKLSREDQHRLQPKDINDSVKFYMENNPHVLYNQCAPMVRDCVYQITPTYLAQQQQQQHRYQQQTPPPSPSQRYDYQRPNPSPQQSPYYRGSQTPPPPAQSTYPAYNNQNPPVMRQQQPSPMMGQSNNTYFQYPCVNPYYQQQQPTHPRLNRNDEVVDSQREQFIAEEQPSDSALPQEPKDIMTGNDSRVAPSEQPIATIEKNIQPNTEIVPSVEKSLVDLRVEQVSESNSVLNQVPDTLSHESNFSKECPSSSDSFSSGLDALRISCDEEKVLACIEDVGNDCGASSVFNALQKEATEFEKMISSTLSAVNSVSREMKKSMSSITAVATSSSIITGTISSPPILDIKVARFHESPIDGQKSGHVIIEEII